MLVPEDVISSAEHALHGSRAGQGRVVLYEQRETLLPVQAGEFPRLHLAPPALGVQRFLDELPNIEPILIHDSGALQEGKWERRWLP